MHIFLTGQIQVGKSTLLRRVLAEHPTLRLSGFRTEMAAVTQRPGPVYIVPAAEFPPQHTSERCVAVRATGGRGLTPFPEVFDAQGAAFLHDAEEADLIVMDEIGFLEADAARFSGRIMELLDGGTPVFGVVRGSRDTPLLRFVRTHPKVRLIEVTEENRERLFPEVAALLRSELGGGDAPHSE